ncbi:retropepsin-like aspartic protease [Candidatus Thiosymbion oneisti]|uniref:retropepsin-like aspartic protease n=1 Tax=Candidatus Thiosymbion oneisti TaxID=589554 RepID=UPI001A9CAD08|nr:retropepsin-like aspartic protease [Candidatus Thiosymbion oneisti]
MKLRLDGGLPFVTIEIGWEHSSLMLKPVLLDTGSASTVLSADRLGTLGIKLEPEDPIHRIVGVGGSEFVYCKRLPWVALGDCRVHDVPVEVGAMSYGFRIEGILGMDFMQQIGLIIDLRKFEVSCGVTG